ncbi:MAG: ACP S-malonyltransferase [Clostridiales bacterium]|jgi:[acyl-carrier-protein] S-malonyltransferase|nr:ACP S-malonyltransferase [Clostridiales bacterium]
MKIGFLFAGQGSQTVGMGRALYDSFPSARRVFDEAELDFDLKELCFYGPAEKLNQTAFTQPCMVAVAAAATEALAEHGIKPDIAAGLSLGEYSALCAAGVFDYKTAIKIARFRGLAMERAVKGINGRMAAVIGLDRDKLRQVCKKASDCGVVQIANYNCPGQMVIGGEAAAVDKAARIALECGAKRVLPLNVSGPFHTALLEQASRDLAEYFKGIEFKTPKIPVVFNSTADTLKTGQTIPDLLARQVMSPVYFEDSLRRMEREKVDVMIEIGPGRVLSGFVRKTCPSVKVFWVEDTHSLNDTLKALREIDKS